MTVHKYISAALALCAVAVSSSIVAQESASPDEGGKLPPEVIVTGTHIQQTGMNTPTPVTVVSAVQLKEMKPGPIIEALNQMPQFLNNSTPGNSYNFSTTSGQSFLNMRGLGINRTLVLLDGRRITPASRLGATDISVFPQALIQRVDVVTGGASAAYGSDAVAGVANFVLNTKFTGIQASLTGGMTELGDNQNDGYSFTFGKKFGDRFHLIGSTEFYQAHRVETYDGRDWMQDWGLVTSPQWRANGTGPRMLTLPHVSSTRYTFGGLVNQPGSSLNRLMFQPDGTATPFILGPVSVVGSGTFSQSGGIGDNYERDRTGDGSLYPELERSSAFAYLSYDISDNFTAFVQGIYGHSMTNYVEVGAVQFSQWEGRIYQDNAYLPASIRQAMVNEGLQSFGLSRMGSFADLGRSRNQTSNNMLSYTVGLKGEVGGWRTNAYYQDGENQSDSYLIDYIRTDRLALAQDAVVNPANGGIVCRSTLFNPGNGCVPINLLGVGNASKEALSYVYDNKYGYATVRQKFAEFSANREVWKGWGAGAVSAALGVSWRKDSLEQHASPADGTLFVPQNNPAQGIQGIPLGFIGNPFVYQFSSFPTLAGDYSVKEAFAELLLPLLSNRSWARQLNLSLAGRFADYSGSGGVWAYKGGLDWQIVDAFRVRGTLSRDTRAANLAERFDAQGGGVTVRDPLFGNSNVTLSQFQTGNPAVDPEKADTVTIGTVFTPDFVPGFQLSVDWYSIDNKDAIALLGSQIIVNNCAAGATQFCSLITRDAATNQLVFVRNQYLNVSKTKVSGIDVEADYTHGINLFGGPSEQFSARLIGSYLEENSVTNQAVGTRDYAGQTGDNFSLPRLQVTGNVAYSRGGLKALVQERYIAKGKLDILYQEGIDIDDNVVGSVAYTDLDVSYTSDSWVSHSSVEVFGHVTNLFDRAPPLAPGFTDFRGAEQANQTVYDVLGRRFTLGVTMRF